MIFNLSILQGIVPEKLKFAKVVLILVYKKDAAEVFYNYCPVLVLPCFFESERLVFKRCMRFIDKHKILNKQQFGFRPNHSTSMAIT